MAEYTPTIEDLARAAYCGYGNWEPCGQTEPGLLSFLATTGMEASDPGLWITAGLLMLGGGILFAYNHARNKE